MVYYKISKELVEAIFNYLKRQPFEEVANLIMNLQKSEGPLEEERSTNVEEQKLRANNE